LADKCEIQAGFAIGIAEPVSLAVNCFGTNKVSEEEVIDFVKNNFSFRLQNIIDELDLLRVNYKRTACFGHFGNNDFPWEQIKNI
jgi:S-adenosylmethionine synthetase